MTQQLQIPNQDCGTQVRELTSDETQQVSAGGFFVRPSVAVGDINATGDVDGRDFLIWQRH